MSKLQETDSSDDDDVLYSLNSDISSIDSDDLDSNNETDRSSDDEHITMNDSQDELWSGKILKPKLSRYIGKLQLSSDFQSNIPRNPSPIDFFQLFFTPELASYIVDQSNLYRIQTNKIKQPPMTEDDLYCLLGFLFYASIVPLPNKRDYWSSFSKQSVVADTITRDRILYLLSILHFHDNSVEKHKVEKVKPILEYFNERCKLVTQPENTFSIDEQMIGYKGTTAPRSFRQYMPNKPTKRGFKVWTRCGVSAFVYEMILYHGALKVNADGPSLSDLSSKRKRSFRKTTITTSTTSKDDKSTDAQREALRKEYGSSGMVVLDLMNNIPLGSSVYFDNYFASTKLIQKLTQMGYRVICTLRPNRIQHCPISTIKQFETKERGYYEYYISDNSKCIVIGWKDSKRVLLGSNHVDTKPEITVERWDKHQHRKVHITAPQIVTQYNKFMGGVDTLDMLVSMHPIPFKSKRWYTRIIWRIFDLMIINSWILMKHGGHAVQYGGTSQGSFRLFHFKSEIAKVLLKRTKLRQLPSTSNDLTSQESDSDNEEEDETPTKKLREIATSVPQSTRYDGVNHWPIFVSGINNTRYYWHNFHAETVHYSFNQAMYGKFRRQCFEFVEIQRTLSNKLQQMNDTGNLIRFHYLYEFGARCQFNKEFHQLWMTHFGEHPDLNKEKMAISLTSKHLHSLNALWTQQKSSCQLLF